MTPSSALTKLELLIVSNDYSTLKMFARSWRDTGAHLDSTPSLACAEDLIVNREIHGIVVDAAIKGAFEFIRRIKESRGQGAPVIVACAGDPQEERAALDAGANFVAQKPASASRVFDLLTLSRQNSQTQRRRFPRHKLIAPITIFSAGSQCRALLSDLSERGMSIRSAQAFAPAATLQFVFDVRSSAAIVGQGRVMWSNDDGYAGISFDSVRCSSSLPFGEWLEKHSVMLNA